MTKSLIKPTGVGKQSSALPAIYEGISPFLNREELVYVKAFFDVKVVDLMQEKAERAILECINRAYAELGQTPSGSRSEDRQHSLIAMTRLILTDLKFYFPYVTMAEVSQAIRKGIRHEYGQYFGFNVIAVHGFVEKYLESEERGAALERQNHHKLAQKATEELSLEEQLKLMEEGLKHCEETYRKTGRIIDFGNVNYQMLVDRGNINLTDEQKKEIYKMAELEIKRDLENQELSLSKQLFLRKNPTNNEFELIARAKEISLKMYFDSKKQSARSN